MKQEQIKQSQNFEDSNIIQISSKVLPIWKVALSWIGMLAVFLFCKTIHWLLASVLLTVGMVGILGYQYGLSSLRKFFGPMKSGTKRWIGGYLLLGLVFSAGLVLLFKPAPLSHSSMDGMSKLSIIDFILTMGVMTFSLIGEEVAVAILAFPMFGYLNNWAHFKKSAFFLSSLFSSLIFGLAHLPVYNWDWFQCLVVTGLGRIFYNYAWRKSDSLWAGFWVHTLNNWIAFGAAYFVKLH
ncbi:CPBP family glutamic-type intramembrane protease [Enterococcus sp. AZ007]|uniref:CPBP family glutamic-type intramembrane protease n=1 Tax=Enterococcus sp. AZ007 TaxID=2774839 RepID=UPI003F20C9E8